MTVVRLVKGRESKTLEFYREHTNFLPESWKWILSHRIFRYLDTYTHKWMHTYIHIPFCMCKDICISRHVYLYIFVNVDVCMDGQERVWKFWSKVKLLSHVWPFATPWTVAHQASLSMRFSREEYWIGLPFPSPGDLPDPGIEPRSPALPADALTSELLIVIIDGDQGCES